MEYKVLYTFMIVVSFVVCVNSISILGGKYRNDSLLSNILALVIALLIVNAFIYAVGRLIIWIWS